MMGRISSLLAARYQAAWWLSWRSSPRPDVMVGLERCKWLAAQKRAGRLIDPTVEIRRDDGLGDRLKLGERTAIDKGAILWLEGGDSRMTLGNDVYVGPHVYLGSHRNLAIGENSIIGAFSYLITCNHRFERRDLPIRDQGYAGGDITVGSDVWLGCHVVVLPGVTIGDGAIVAAGAVVNRDVPAGQIWGGVPAKFLKER